MQSKQNIPTILRLLSFVVITALVCTILAGFNLTSFASGSGNDYGDQPHVSGSSAENGYGIWYPSGWGYRVTLVYADTGNPVYVSGGKPSTYGIQASTDYTNFTGVTSSDVSQYASDKNAEAIPLEEYYTLGGHCKTYYTNGGFMALQETYTARKPPTVKVNGVTVSFPLAVNTGSATVNSEARKKYFTSEDFISSFASAIRIKYDEVISGKYKIMYEPVLYVNYPEFDYGLAGTITEFAKFDLMTQYYEFTGEMKNYFTLKWSEQWLCYYWATSIGLEREEWGKFPAYDDIKKDKTNIKAGKTYVTGFKQETIRDKLGFATVTFTDAPSTPTTIKVYYHLYNSSDVQTSLKTSTFDLGTSTTKQFTPSTEYGTPVAACVENNPPSTNSYPFTPYRVRSVGNPDSKSKLTTSLTVTSSDVSNNYTIHVKVIDTTPPPATVKVPVYYYYYDGYGNQTSCSSSVESYVELNKTNWRYF